MTGGSRRNEGAHYQWPPSSTQAAVLCCLQVVITAGKEHVLAEKQWVARWGQTVVTSCSGERGTACVHYSS